MYCVVCGGAASPPEPSHRDQRLFGVSQKCEECSTRQMAVLHRGGGIRPESCKTAESIRRTVSSTFVCLRVLSILNPTVDANAKHHSILPTPCRTSSSRLFVRLLWALVLAARTQLKCFEEARQRSVLGGLSTESSVARAGGIRMRKLAVC